MRKTTLKTRILLFVLIALMVLSLATTTIYMLIAGFTDDDAEKNDEKTEQGDTKNDGEEGYY